MADISSLQIGNNAYDFKDSTARSGLSNKQDIIQKTTLPIASSTEVGNIYQYTGTTNANYTNGYFYKCIEDSNNSGSYIWVQVEVQASSGGSAITITPTLTLTVAGWDTTTKQQTVLTTIDTTKRNVIDITVGELPTWSECNVYAISESATGVTFQCDTIPSDALTFKITSMEVTSNAG